MKEFQGIEIKKHGEEIRYGFAKLPDRKKVSLYRKKDGVITPMAQFIKDEHATEFLEWMEELVNRINSIS
jgi:hypothetical protein